jgi:hypothetical protein
MPHDFEQMLKEIFGESISRLSRFESDQMAKLTGKLQDLAREAVKDDLARLTQEVADLRARVATLEADRVAASAEQV